MLSCKNCRGFVSGDNQRALAKLPHPLQTREKMRFRAAIAVLLLSLLAASEAFKAHEFRYCQDSSFCRRHRKFATMEHAHATYSLHDLKQQSDGSVTGQLKNEMDSTRPLSLTITALADDVFRVKINEEGGPSKRYEVQDVLVGNTASTIAKDVKLTINGAVATIASGDRSMELQLAPSPFKATMKLGETPILTLNSRDLLKWEVLRDKSAPGALEDITGENDGLWEESFGGHRDTRKKGPASVLPRPIPPPQPRLPLLLLLLSLLFFPSFSHHLSCLSTPQRKPLCPAPLHIDLSHSSPFHTHHRTGPADTLHPFGRRLGRHGRDLDRFQARLRPL
jgi:hypothetical protein